MKYPLVTTPGRYDYIFTADISTTASNRSRIVTLVALGTLSSCHLQTRRCPQRQAQASVAMTDPEFQPYARPAGSELRRASMFVLSVIPAG